MPRRKRKGSKNIVKNRKGKLKGDLGEESNVTESEEYIPLTSVVEDRRQGFLTRKNFKNKLSMVIDGNSLNEDFIPLSCPGNITRNEEVQCHKMEAPIYSLRTSKLVNADTIVIDDDCDDYKCEDGNIVDSNKNKPVIMNDSIEIIVEKSLERSSNKKRKSLDDSLEICEERVIRPLCKKAKIVPSCSKCPVHDTNIQLQPSCTNSRNGKDDDIIIIDSVDKGDNIIVLEDIPAQKSVDKRESIIVLEDIPPNKFPSAHLNNKKTRNRANRFIHEANTDEVKSVNSNLDISFVFEDFSGTSPKKSAKYKSPISCVSSTSVDSNATFSNTNGNNIYNPNPNVEKKGLRPVVIDGSNVAYGHGGKRFSTRGLEICINYFVKRGHMVVAFVPLFRRSEVSESDRKILDDLQTQRILSFTPSRFLHGRRVASYDDRFIVQCAAELGGVIVSTDNYRDLVMENEAWRETIEKRLLMFTWVGDILMFPDDPNGRSGPRLEEFLRFPQ